MTDGTERGAAADEEMERPAVSAFLPALNDTGRYLQGTNGTVDRYRASASHAIHTTWTPPVGLPYNVYDNSSHEWDPEYYFRDNWTSEAWGNATAGAMAEDGVPSTFSDVMGIWITGSVCLLGFIGNVISFIILLQAFKRSPMFYVLRAVAVSDAIFLFTVFVIQTLVNMYPYTGLFYWCYSYRGYIQYATWPLLMITQMSTVWLTVLVSAERYVAICFPLKAASFCTLPKVRRLSLGIFALSTVYNVPRFFEYEVVSNMNMGKTEVGAHEVYRYLYCCVLYSLLLFFIPLAMLVVLNAKLIWSLESGRRQWQRLSCNQKREQMITVIPLCIVVVFFVCGTPALIVNIVDSIYPDIYGYYPHFVTFMVVANLLVVLNSACNFIIYCLLGKKFRAKLMDLCRCRMGSRYRAVHHLVSGQYTDGPTVEGTTEM